MANKKAGRYFARGILEPEILHAAGIVAVHAGQHSDDPATGEKRTGVEVGAVTDVLRELTRAALAQDAGTALIERTLLASATLLGNLAVSWTVYATQADCTEQLELYSRLALKAQNQQRQTLRTLAEIRNPRRATFVQQQNNAVNQQVNNSPVVSQTGKIPNSTASELLEVNRAQRRWMDAGTPALAVGDDASLETVAIQYRPEE